MTGLDDYRLFKAEGERIDREGMSQRAIKAVEEWQASGATYKGAMILAGRLKAVAMMASADEYWREQVDKGMHKERALCRRGCRMTYRRPFLCRCDSCGHVWPIAWLPIPVHHMGKLGKAPCPACGGSKVMVANERDAAAFNAIPGRAPCFVEVQS